MKDFIKYSYKTNDFLRKQAKVKILHDRDFIGGPGNGSFPLCEGPYHRPLGSNSKIKKF